jgi:iron complex transport system permease protein
LANRNENTAAVSERPYDARLGYHRLIRRRSTFIWSGCGLLALSFLLDVMTGPAMLSVRDVFSAIFTPDAVRSITGTIVWTFRLPTALFALLVGASLGIAGAQMQTILDNPLASPYTLGVSAAAGFGAALAIILGCGAIPLAATLAVPASAFFFAMLCSMAVYGIAHVKKGAADAIILGGVALLFLFNSAVAFLQYVASEEELQAIVFWMFGSLQGATWPKLAVVSVVLFVCAPLLALKAWPLTALRMGDERARGLGINVRRLRLQTLVLVSTLTATAVCFAGSIGFIGLVAPHLARMMVGEDQRFFLPLSALTGAFLLSVASTASKAVIPGAIFPIGIATAFLGVPFFAVMVLSRKRAYW